MHQLRIFIIFLVFTGTYCSAQQNYFTYLTAKDGLSDHSINSFYEDEYARMWVATRNGLNCFNTHTFQVWSRHNGLNDTYIRRVTGDKKGHLLIQTRNDAFVMDMVNDSIIPVPLPHISTIAGCEYGLWVASKDTLYSLQVEDTLRIIPVLTVPGITTVQATGAKHIWVAADDGVRLYIEGQPTSLWYEEMKHVSFLYEDSHRQLWVCTRNDGLFQCTPAQTIHYTHLPNDPNSLTDNDVRCITEDQTGSYWIGLYGGLCCLNSDTHSILRYEYDPRAEHALNTFSVWALSTDCQGTVWVGTFFGGIDLINPRLSMYSYYGAFGRNGYRLSNPIVTGTCKTEEDHLWIGTNGGGVNLLNRNTGAITAYPLTRDNPQYAVKAMWWDETNHRLWIGSHRGGLHWLDIKPNNHRFVSCPLPEANIRQLIPLKDSLCVMTQHNLFLVSRQNGGYRQLVPAHQMPVITGELSDMVLHGGYIWFAKANQLYAYSLSKPDDLLHYDLQANVITLHADSLNGLLIGTDCYGVLQKQDSLFMPVTALNKQLTSQYVVDIKSNGLYYLVATGHSLHLSDTHFEHIRTISLSEDFPLESIIEHSCSFNGNEICAGGVNGLTIISLQKQLTSIAPVSIALSQVSIDNVPSRHSLFTDSVITLQPNNQMLSFVITATGAITRHNCRLRYRLRNYNKNWMEIDNNATVTYSRLPKGTYTLDIECLNSPLTKHVVIRVLPHWYETWWAWTIYFLLGGGIFFGGIIWFAQYIEKKTARKLSSEYQSELLKATNIVMNHLADSEFNVERFAKEMLLSRTGLFTKVQQISGQTPNDFILGIRMREAAKLLRTEPNLSIMDISVRVGFNSCSYFTKCFHAYFGSTPSSWRKENE